MIPSLAAIITAAGKSERFSDKVKKEYLSIDGHTVLYRATKPFFELPNVKAVVVTYPEEAEDEAVVALEDLMDIGGIPLLLCKGGDTRFLSIKSAIEMLKKLPISFDFIAVHDGDRPYVSSSLILETLASAKMAGGAAPALSVTDALREVDNNLIVKKCVERKNLFLLQTPQIFESDKLIKAYEEYGKNTADDDVEVFTSQGFTCTLLPGSRENIKITYKSDLKNADEQISDYIKTRERGRESRKAIKRMRELQSGKE